MRRSRAQVRGVVVDDEPCTMRCAEHGERQATFVCRHIVEGAGRGFNFAVSDDDDQVAWPDAWCDECNEVYEAEDGWSEENEAVLAVTAICDFCYMRARERNFHHDREAYLELVEHSVEYLKKRQAALRETYSMGDLDHFSWDQTSGQLVLSLAGERAVVAEIVFVGSISSRSGTWLWSWANPSYLEAVKAPMRELRERGLELDLLPLAGACWQGDETDGWEMTSIAAFVLGAVGAYRSPGDDGFSFMIMTSVGWAQ